MKLHCCIDLCCVGRCPGQLSLTEGCIEWMKHEREDNLSPKNRRQLEDIWQKWIFCWMALQIVSHDSLTRNIVTPVTSTREAKLMHIAHLHPLIPPPSSYSSFAFSISAIIWIHNATCFRTAYWQHLNVLRFSIADINSTNRCSHTCPCSYSFTRNKSWKNRCKVEGNPPSWTIQRIA